ncbi:MAG: 7-cyano-7-deazaguanine synthase QueC [Sphingobacteriia bacterium]|jgi:7-cyano-7-deazaguanine synthase
MPQLNPHHAILLFSGGQDSTTCLYWALGRFEKVYALIIGYAQRHRVEMDQAQRIAARAGTPVQIMDSDLGKYFARNALTDTTQEVKDEIGSEQALPGTFVPGRNLMFLTLAGMYAWGAGAGSIVLGVNQADYAGYPDCREPFIESAQRTLGLALDQPIQLHTPLMHKTKAEIWQMAQRLGCLEVVIHDSHSCYRGDRGHKHAWGYGCGSCSACQLRARGYHEAFSTTS